MSDESTGHGNSKTSARDLSPPDIKQCCAAVYDSDAAKLLLGGSFHPGGVKLTERLGQLLDLKPQTRVLDVAAGRGTSGIFLAKRFGCEVVGVDFSQKNVEDANCTAQEMGLAERASFRWADAERLSFADSSFDAVICECSFCLFPDKQVAASEFARVLAAGGQVGLSDLTRMETLSRDLDGLMSWIACIADARPLTAYVAHLSAANLAVRIVEEHNQLLAEFVNGIRTRLLAAEIAAGLGKLVLPGFDLDAAKKLVRSAQEAIAQGKLGYAIVTAIKPA
ncbi:class I SAM-dependent methyltransferase [Bradyrhizobium zhanjiangense]|uniref:class I SAM-dependent methyltransferase n=1 Tax=Bradyrhizobium zhanjiangense TaxID=1325107 RepID=UPI001008FE81|nr:class I SAM-dependent methyltransferase [Bradyrhizobium zhanjiangense]